MWVEVRSDGRDTAVCTMVCRLDEAWHVRSNNLELGSTRDGDGTSTLLPCSIPFMDDDKGTYVQVGCVLIRIC